VFRTPPYGYGIAIGWTPDKEVDCAGVFRPLVVRPSPVADPVLRIIGLTPEFTSP